MLQESTKDLLMEIVHSLEISGEAGWDDQIEFGQECLYEMHQMTRPAHRAYKAMSLDRWPTHIPDSERLHRAMPCVKAMVSAIRRKDRAAAVESGKAAIAEMNGATYPIISARCTEPKTESKQASIIVRRQANPTRKRHRVTDDLRCSRPIRVSNGKRGCQ
jgi:hypothetical protein